MNIHQIIAEEVTTVLKEGDDAKVVAALDALIQELPGEFIAELEKVIADNILPYISSLAKGPLKEVDEEPGEEGPGAAEVAKEMGAHAVKTAGAAPKVAGYILSHIPGGKKTGVMIATALDKSVPDHVRNAVLFALGNLIAGSMGFDLPDLGDLIQEIPETMWEMLPFTDNNQEWDWGALNAADDGALLTWAWLKVKNTVDVEEKLQEFGKFIGRSDLGKQPETAPEGPSGFDRDDTSLDAKAARVAAAREKGKEFRGIKEMKIKTSQLYKMIKEELEVILTNEEAKEIFDLNMSALLDEMMNEDDDKSESEGAKFATPTERVKQLRRKRREAREGGDVGDAVELQEKEDKSFSKAGEEIEKKGTEGVFTAKADKAGMGVQAYAAKVLKKGSKASTKTKRQAAFAKGAATVARENK
jgi:hypothetical protein